METVTGLWNLLLFIVFSPNNDTALGVLILFVLVLAFAVYGLAALIRKCIS